MNKTCIGLVLLLSLFAFPVNSHAADQVRFAYISDSPGSSAPYWIAKEAGIFKKYGLDTELIFINGSTRGIQSMIAGDIDFAGAVGTSAMNGAMAGGDVMIVDSLVNTLPYYIIGKSSIKSPEDLKGRSAATHIPGTSADFALRLALRKFGIDYTDIKAVMVGGAAARVAAVHQWTGGFYDGDRFGKNSRREGGVEGHHRHGQIENPVSIYLHGNHESDHPSASANGGKHGQGGGRGRAFL